MRNAQRNDGLVTAVDQQLARKALEKITNLKLTAMVRPLPVTQLVEKLQQEEISSTDFDWHKIKKNCTLSPSINIISTEIDYLTIDDIRAVEQDIACGINVIRQGTQLIRIQYVKNAFVQEIVYQLDLIVDTQNLLMNIISQNKHLVKL